jgi:AcrR family transcriptional regulator
MVNDEARDSRHRRSQHERRAATRGALLDAGRRLFGEKGFAATGREEIVDAAGVTRGALYHHFSSKEALFRQVYEQLETEVMAQVMEVALTGSTALDQLRLGSLAYLDAALDPAFQRVVLLDGPGVLSLEDRQAVAEAHALGVVRETLRAAIAEGSIDDQPVEPLAHLLVAALHEAALYVARAGPGGAATERARHEAGATVERLVSRL